MLRYADGVVVAKDYQQAPFLILCTEREVVLLISFRISLRSTHIAFSVHHLIQTPINYRATSHSHLEDIRIGKHHIRCHKATVAPAMDSQSVGIHERKAFPEVYALHLVAHFVCSQVSQCYVLESKTALIAAAVVQ